MGAVAIGAGAVIAAGGVIGGGIIKGKAAKKAKRQAKDNFNDLMRQFKNQLKENKKNLDPFVEGGQLANRNLLGTAAGEEVLDFRDTEGFRFRQENLERQIRRSLSARGLNLSGAAIEAEARGNLQLSAEENKFHFSLLDSLATRGVQAGGILASAGASLFGGAVGATGQFNQLASSLQLSKGAAEAGAVEGSTGIIGSTLSSGGFAQASGDFDFFQTRGQSQAGGGGAGF